MSGSLLIKLAVGGDRDAIEQAIRTSLGDSLFFFHVRPTVSELQSIVIEVGPTSVEEGLGTDLPRRKCEELAATLQGTGPSALRSISALWLNDEDWYYGCVLNAQDSSAA